MKVLIKITYVLILTLVLTAGEEGYEQIRAVNAKGDFIRSDELGNVFLVDDNQLIKYNSEGRKLHSYTNLYSGDITFVDTHDPFKILLYYRSFGQVEFLDHTLSLASSSIDLNSLGLSLATLVCASYQGAFWVYDPMNFELVRISAGLEVSERTGNLVQVTGLSPEPNYLLERDNFLYLNDPETGIMMFDKYGTFYKTIPVKGLNSFQVFNNRIIYTEGEEIFIYDIKLNELSSASLPAGNKKSVSLCLSLDPQMLFVLQEEKLIYYNIK
ncbi:MAG: hypothetical protein V2I47_13770 [Bacteroidales bacterium]|jgi:hypothetical protein|nr:hypothetical protein [Bacteroidales bacterium]